MERQYALNNLPQLVSKAPNRIAMYDKNMRYIACSRRWHSHYLHDVETPIGQCHYDLRPNQPEEWKRAHSRGMKGEPVLKSLDSWTDETGNSFYFHWAVVPWWTDKNEVGGILVITEDETFHREAFKALQDSEERYELAVQATENGIYDWDVEKNTIYWSAQFRHILGLPKESEASLELWASRLEDPLQVMHDFSISMEDPSQFSFSVAYVAIRPDGQKIPIVSQGVIQRDQSGKAVRVVGSIIDRMPFTELERQAEESSKRAEIEAEANLAKNRFVATFGHEIRNPLNGILGIVDILEHHDLPSKTQELLSIQKSAILHLSGLLNDVLDYSTIEAGELQLNNRAFNIEELVHDAARLFESRCQHKGLAFKTKISLNDNKVRHYFGDPLRIKQIIQNYLSNAFKFTSRGSIELWVECKPGDDGKDNISFKVIDTGIGIPTNHLRTLFTPFKQAHRKLKDEFGGTGLGLSIVKNLCERMHGDVSVLSTLNQGSTFTATIQLEQLTHFEASNHPAPEIEKTLEKRSILLLDDDDISRKVTATLLEHHGMHVEHAWSTEMALMKLDSTEFDLVISDLDTLEDSSENFIVQANTSLSSSHKIPLICLSGYCSEEDRKRIVDMGFHAHLPKPVEIEVLLQTIHQVTS